MIAPHAKLRDFREGDAAQVVAVALAAFDEFRTHYADWPAMAASLSNLPRLAESGEIVVAEAGEQIAGAVAYIAPSQPKAAYFQPEWPVIRMLVVDPAHRGEGIGRALTEECLARARRDRSPVIALHTSPIMAVALPLYLRMGFELVREAPPIHGVPYAVYVKRLELE
jgi:ribosomal protein S18 acetylase RimI-like enzyme